MFKLPGVQVSQGLLIFLTWRCWQLRFKLVLLKDVARSRLIIFIRLYWETNFLSNDIEISCESVVWNDS